MAYRPPEPHLVVSSWRDSRFKWGVPWASETAREIPGRENTWVRAAARLFLAAVDRQVPAV
eukprot:2464971-Pyramimonas_sp.AAC.1